MEKPTGRKNISCVILAAGASTRMGTQKLLLPFGDNTILGTTLAKIKSCGIGDIRIVLGANAAEIKQKVDLKGLTIIYNSDYLQGQSTSVKLAVKDISGDSGVMFALGDQPLVKKETFLALLKAYRKSDALAVFPVTKDGRRGNPVIFSPQTFADISLLQGDTGPRKLLEAYGNKAISIVVEDEHIHSDIDTPEEYKKYQRDEKDESFN